MVREEKLKKMELKTQKSSAESQSNDAPTTSSAAHTSDRTAIQSDLQDMIQFASQRGISLPTNIAFGELKDDATLIANYNSMVKTVEPATIQSIHYVNHHVLGGQGEEKKWHAIPIISKCLFIAAIALICLIAISLSPNVNEQHQSEGLLNSDGMTLLYNLIFICSASLLGVMFYLLKTINDKIKNYTLLPVDAIEVNATIIIGVIAGFVISELFTFSPSTLGNSIEMQKMTLALLGGFSSDALFSILKGIVNRMKTLFSTHTGE